MEQNPSWEADSHAASQEIPRLLWNPKVNYCVHKSPPLVSILREMNPVYILPPLFFNIQSNVILPSTHSLPSGFFPSGFRIKILYAFLMFPMRAETTRYTKYWCMI